MIVKPPCEPFDERLFVDSPAAAKWAVETFPDWLPMELLTEEYAKTLMEGEHEPETGC